MRASSPSRRSLLAWLGGLAAWLLGRPAPASPSCTRPAAPTAPAVADPTGAAAQGTRTASMSWSAPGDPLGARTTYAYDGTGRLVQSQDRALDTRVSSYDAEGVLLGGREERVVEEDGSRWVRVTSFGPDGRSTGSIRYPA